jgi:hypothetical protein
MDFSSIILEILGTNPDVAEGSKQTLTRFKSNKPDEYFDELFRLLKGKLSVVVLFKKVEMLMFASFVLQLLMRT